MDDVERMMLLELVEVEDVEAPIEPMPLFPSLSVAAEELLI